MDELARIKKAVGKVTLPKHVREVKFRLDEDWTGDPIVYIYVILADDEADSERFHRDVMEITREVTQAVFDIGIDRWPHVRFRSESEEREIAALR